MDEKELEILQKSIEIFIQYGIKSQSMDDIARHNGVSKKTLYKYFKDKNDLVLKAVNCRHVSECNMMESILNEDLNAIDELYEMSKYVIKALSNVSPVILFDLKKYYPEAWSYMDKNEKSAIYEHMLININKGIKEKLYRADLKPEIVLQGYLAMVDTMFNSTSESFEKYSLRDMYIEIFRYHIRGIASEKGLEYLITKIKKENLH